MVYEEVKFGENALSIKKDDVIEGVLENIREDVGPNKSRLYTIGGKTYWGSRALDALLDNVSVGQKVKILCTDDKFKFPSGQTGKAFKVEVWKE